LGKKRRSGQRQQGKEKPPLVRPSKHSKRGVLAVVQEPTKAKKGAWCAVGRTPKSKAEGAGRAKGTREKHEKGTI